MFLKSYMSVLDNEIEKSINLNQIAFLKTREEKMEKKDKYQNELYERLHETETQKKFKLIAPIPVGCVFIQSPDMGWEDIRWHLRKMKELGFTCLKGFMLIDGYDPAKFMHMALDEGIIPWWYDEAGWEAITPRLLKKLGIPEDIPVEQIRQDKRFLEYQMQIMRKRIDKEVKLLKKDLKKEKNLKQDKLWVRSEISLKTREVYIEPEFEKEFIRWLKKKYKTLDNLKKAWNTDCAGIIGNSWTKWEEAVESVRKGVNQRDLKRLMDVIRFYADLFLEHIREKAEAHRKVDPHAPFRAGGEMSVFFPLMGRGVDMEGIADIMAEYGSLYPSTHPAWHFDVVDYELAVPVYIYSSFMRDLFKGGWAATWESTGGPQQLSGDKGWTLYARENLPGYTIDENIMTQLMLTYLAAGYRGFGFWCWTPRTAGREAGEYSLLTRNGEIGPRAIIVGKIGQAARKLRDEIWHANKEPMVGVLYDRDNDMLWGALAHSYRDFVADIPVRARIGAGRAFVNNNIPWEFVTSTDLRAGLISRYEIIYLPAILCVASDIMEILIQYVEDGGRVVIDMPSAYYDENARLLGTGRGTKFEKLFGCIIDDFQYSSRNNVLWKIEDKPLEGFVINIRPTSAEVKINFSNGKPAVTVNKLGKGEACVVGFQLALSCFKAGSWDNEKILIKYVLDGRRPDYACKDAIVYKLASPTADHFFIINKGERRKVILEVSPDKYSKMFDVISGEEIALNTPFEVNDYGGRWLRLLKV